MLHPNALYLASLEVPDFFCKTRFSTTFPYGVVVSIKYSILSLHRPEFKFHQFHFIFHLSFLISLINHSKFPTFPQIWRYSGTICLVSYQNLQFLSSYFFFFVNLMYQRNKISMPCRISQKFPDIQEFLL